jgi:hypothetical protein
MMKRYILGAGLFLCFMLPGISVFAAEELLPVSETLPAPDILPAQADEPDPPVDEPGQYEQRYGYLSEDGRSYITEDGATVPNLLADKYFNGGPLQAALPSFKVTLNGQLIANDYRKYPLLVFRDMTYIPMTYQDARFLNLQTSWQPDTGLEIWKRDEYSPVLDAEMLPRKNNPSYAVEVVWSWVTINGYSHSFEDGKYPLLLFRNITYVPLHWNLAMDESEFGWAEYRFDQEDGLVIWSRK